MARADVDPLDFSVVLPEEAFAELPESQYQPQAPAQRSPALQNQNLSYAYDYLLKQGFKPHQAAGIVGNLAQESGGNTGAVGGKILPGEAYSFGAAQWNKERLHGGKGYTGLLPFAKAQGLDPSNLYTQLDYMMHELKGPERKALEGILASKNVDEATRVFGEAYERPNAKYANYENRIAQARQYLGDAPAEMPQGPQGETYDIPLSNGQTLTVPKDVSRQDAINGLRAQGMDVEGVIDHPLTNGKTLTLPESVNVNDALVDLQKQFPDQEWMTKAHAGKTGFLPAAGAAFKGVGAQFERGAGELLKSPELIAKGKAWQEELAKEVEAPLPTDPLSKKLAYYGGTALGGLAPLGAAVVAAPLLPEAAAMGALGAATVPIATGSLAQRYDEQGKPFDPYELQNIGAVGTEAVLQTLPFTKFAPVAGQVGKSLAKGAAGAAAADVPSVAIERAAAGQPLADEQALEEYAGTLAADVLAGGTLGAVGGMRGRGVRTPEVPPVQEGAAPRPIEPAPEGGETLAPTEGPVESVEDLEAQARAGEEFFRQAEAAGIPPETIAPEMAAPEAEIPEPTVRGREQAVPTVEEDLFGAPLSEEEALAISKEKEKAFNEEIAATSEPHFAESILGLKPTKAKTSLYNKLQGLDIGNVEDHPRIEELVAGSKILSGDKLDALSARMKEVEDASSQQIPEPLDAGRGARPQGGEEIGYPTEGGEGVRISDQEGQRLAGEGEKESLKQVGDLGAGITEPLYKDLWKGYSGEGAMRADPIVQTAHKIAEHRQAKFNEAEFKSFAKEFGGADTPEAKAEIANRFAAGKPEEVKFAKAEEPTHIDVDGVQRPVHDSTGQRIHTTDEGVKNFWKGFEGTKVTDEEGRPLRVFHSGAFDENENAIPNIGNNGFHLGTKRAAEERILGKAVEDEVAAQDVFEEGGRYFVDEDTFPEAPINGFKSEASARLYMAGEINNWDLDVPDDVPLTQAYVNLKNPKRVEDQAHDWSKVIADAKAEGYDGIVYRNNYEDKGKDSYIAFYPEQIKSAIGNVGKFDTTKPDIREARGIAPEAAHSVESLNDHIVKTYGKNAPQVEVLTREQAGVEPNVKGFYDPNTKRVTLIADNIGKGEDVHGLMRHEVAVHAKRLGKTDPEFQSILDRLQKLKEQGDATVAKAYDRVPKDTTPENIHEEALAYLTQHAPNLPISKSFMSWLRRTAHKLTGSSNWLKADDFAPMADAILKKGEPTAAPKERMYSIGDTADEAVRNADTETWFERFYTPIRTQYASVRAPLEAILGKLPLYDENNEIRATAKIAQQTRYAHLVSEALHNGYLKRNAQGLVEAVFDPRLSPDRLIKRVMELPEDLRDRFSESMVTLAQAGHNLRGAEMKAVMDEAQRKIKLGQAYLDRTKSNYDKTKATLDTLKSLSSKMKDNPRVQREIEKAQREFDAAKAEYRNPNYTAGKDYIALQQRLYKAVKDQYGKAQRDEAGRIYDISPAQERAAREFLEATPETKQLAADIRELLMNNAKLLRDTSVISNATYKKFTEAKYNYAPLYMSIEDLDAAMPASAVYLQGGQRKVMPVKGLKGGQHQVRFFENLLTHQARTGAMALHNNARLSTLESLAEMGRAKELPGTTPPPKNLDVVAAIKDGKRRYYHVPDRPLYEAFEMVHNLPVPEYITDATKYVSRAMLVDPRYWWNQLVREPFMATFTSRAGIITPYHTGKEFASLLFSELPNVDTSAAKLYRELKAQGVSGSHEYLRNLIKEKGKLEASKGLAKNYKESKDLIMRIHEYADAAAKVAVMRKALARAESGELTGTPLQGDAARDAAITHVGEMINFANRGRNATVQFITQTTPFFNSWAQGMDAIIRNATGYGMDPHAKGKTIAGLRTTFIGHAAAMVAFSAAITALRCEFSEDYRKAEPDEWSGNWLLPIPDSFETKEGRMVKAKGPFELNTLFKLGPEMWVRNWYGLDRDKDYTATLKSSIWRDIAPPGLDHLFMPYLPMLLLESVTGYRASEGEIKPLADTSLAPAERGKGVSPIADVVSAGVLSPASVKHLGQGVFGGMYSLLDSTAKGAAAAFGSDTARADLRDLTEKVPVISGMLTNPDRIELSSAYEFADKQAMARHTAKVLSKRGDKEAAAEYKEEGRYAKQAERIKRKISKTNTAIERLKNTKEYEDADKIQRDYEAMLERKRKQVEKLEALRTKSEEKD